jgi:hypothetical protein
LLAVVGVAADLDATRGCISTRMLTPGRHETSIPSPSADEVTEDRSSI